MKSVEERLSRLENRLAQMEYELRLMSKGGVEAQSAPAPESPSPEPTEPPQPPTARPHAAPRSLDPSFGSARKHGADALPITQILGWTGATALVLAVAYMIRLALDAGWLTPERQLGLAVISGFSLIGTGLWLRPSDRQYASLLPAGGLVVLFLSIYGAHLYYHFIDMEAAAGAVILTCLFTLWLGRLFESEVYGLFAVLGSYSAPFLLHTLAGSVTDLAIYFSAWSMLFCVYSIWIGNRRPYLLAAYLALLGFHFLWKLMAPDEWVAAFAFQTVQFLTFIGGTIGFSIRYARPMTSNEALAHLPLLLIFYALQYSLLHKHLPSLAPWIALGSAGVLLLGYLFTDKVMKQPLESGRLLVGAYAALAVFHAGYMELVPDQFAPWAALLLLPALGIYLMTGRGFASVGWPIRALVLVILAINYVRIIFESDTRTVPAHDLLALCYAAELYVAYCLTRRLPGMAGFAMPALYLGHVALMGAAVHILDGRLAVSFAWSFIALACLALAFKYSDKTLGKSSLLIFAASAAKVLLFDLSSATPLVRIGSLAILGVTLYAGGWMYRKIDLLDAEKP